MPGGFLPSAQAQVCPRRDCGAEPPRGLPIRFEPETVGLRAGKTAKAGKPKPFTDRAVRLRSALKRIFGPPPRKRGRPEAGSRGAGSRPAVRLCQSVAALPAIAGPGATGHPALYRPRYWSRIGTPAIPGRDHAGAQGRRLTSRDRFRGREVACRPDLTIRRLSLAAEACGKACRIRTCRIDPAIRPHRTDVTELIGPCCCGASSRPVFGGGTDARLRPPGRSGSRPAALPRRCHGGEWPEGMSLHAAGSVRLLLWPRTSSSRPRSSIRMNRSQMICISGENPPLRLK